jgi:spore coat-associated protein N
MSRFKVLRANPRRTLAALATLLIAVGVTAASGATFTAHTANPSNTFSAGTLSMDNNRDGLAILSASNLKPGGPAELGEVVIENDGSLDGDFSLSMSDLDESDALAPIAGKLNLVVSDCGADDDCAATGDNAIVYDDTLADMTADVALGNWAAGESHKYEFAVDLDSSANDTLQGKSATAEFSWDAA